MLNYGRFEQPEAMAAIEPARKFALDVGWVLGSSVITLLIGFLVKPLLARWLGASGLGLYSLSLTIYAMTLLIANLGIAQSILKYVAEDKGNRNKVHQIVFSGFTSSLVIGVAAAGLLYVLRSPIAGLFNMTELAGLLPIIALTIPFASLFQSVNGLFNGRRQMRTFALLLIVQSALKTLLIIILVRVGLGIKGAIIGLLLAEIGTSLLGLLLSRNFLRLSLQGYFRNARRLFSFGWQMFAANATNVILNQTDIIMIGYFLTVADVGYYSAAVFIITFLGIVPGAIQRITFPAASAFWSQNNRAALNRMIDKSMKYSACILIPIGLGLGFFAKGIIGLIFGAEFIVAALPLSILLIARVIGGSTVVPIGNVIPGIGRPDINLKIELVVTGINVGLNILLIPPFGIVGAAVATTISRLVGYAIFLVFVIRLLQVKIDVRWHICAFGVALLSVFSFWGLSNFINLYLAGAIILTICVILILRFFLTVEDRTMFISLARSFIPRR